MVPAYSAAVLISIPFFFMLFPGAKEISAFWSRFSEKKSAFKFAFSAPKRINSESFVWRKLFAPVKSHKASIRFVFPWAFSPQIMLTFSPGTISRFSMFRKSEREISKTAYVQLERAYTGIANESAWLIYVKDNSVCVAFDTRQAMNRAIAYLDENITNDGFGTKKGVVAFECFDTVEKANEEREAKQAEGLEKLEPKIGAEAVSALKNLYAMCDENLYMWRWLFGTCGCRISGS